MDFIRPNLPNIPPATHGAIDYAELERHKLNPDEVIDFSVNSNPFGPSPLVRQALEETPLDRYPDRECLVLRRTLSDKLGVPAAQIVAGNGAAELIWLAAFAFLQAGDYVLILGPTFGEYERSVRLVSANPVYSNASPQNGFNIDESEISQLLTHTNFRAVFICNPNNPTGQIISPDTICTWADQNPRTLFMVDEAYHRFVFGYRSLIHNTLPNFIVFRSMTKDYALAGLRLGYAVGNERLIQILSMVRPAWNVNSLAQNAGIAALLDEDYYRTTLAQLREEKFTFVKGLVDLGLSPIPSHTHYFLLPVRSAADIRQMMLKNGILVRDCTSFGLPEYIRISTRKREENQQLIKCLQTNHNIRHYI